jgi:hypothetical protein
MAHKRFDPTLKAMVEAGPAQALFCPVFLPSAQAGLFTALSKALPCSRLPPATPRRYRPGHPGACREIWHKRE